MSEKITSIQVLGSGCPTCHELWERAKQAAAELGIKTEVEYVNDIQAMVAMGIMQSPALAVNGRALMTGGGHSIGDIKGVLGIFDL